VRRSLFKIDIIVYIDDPSNVLQSLTGV